MGERASESMSRRVLFDPYPGYPLAKIEGPGGFTQLPIPERRARAIAEALGIPFVVCVPGTTVPANEGVPARIRP